MPPAVPRTDVHPRTLQEIAVMAAIVTTMLYFPAGALVGLVCYLAGEVPVWQLVTFGGAIFAPFGMVLWWLIGFVPAFVYSAAVSRH